MIVNNNLKNNIFIFFFNLYLLFSTFIFLPFLFIDKFKIHYTELFLINFNIYTVIYFFIFLSLINLFYYVFSILFLKNYKFKFGVIKNYSYLVGLSVIIIIYFFNFIEDLKFNINHISNLFIINLFVLIYFTKNFKTKILIILASIIYLLVIIFNKSIAFNLVFIISILTIVLTNTILSLKKILIFFCIIILSLSCFLFISSKSKTDGIMSISDSTILRLSSFHIINRLIDRTPNCAGNKHIPDKESYELSDNIMNNNTFDYDYLSKLKPYILKDLQRYSKNCDINCLTENFVVNWFDNNNRNFCRSIPYLYGKYYNEPLNNILNIKIFDTNLNNFGNRFARNFGFQPVRGFTTGVGTTILGDGYLNFGIYGIILYSFIISFILILLRLLYQNKHYYIYSCYLFSILLLGYESSMIEAAILLFKISIIPIAVYICEKMYFIFLKRNT